MNPQFGQRINKDCVAKVRDSEKESEHSIQHIAETIIAKFFHVFPTELERQKLYHTRQQVIQSKPRSDFKYYNNRINPDYIRMVKVDAASTDQTIDCVVETIVAKFFVLFQTPEERKRLYDEHSQIKKLKQK